MHVFRKSIRVKIKFPHQISSRGREQNLKVERVMSQCINFWIFWYINMNCNRFYPVEYRRRMKMFAEYETFKSSKGLKLVANYFEIHQIVFIKTPTNPIKIPS